VLKEALQYLPASVTKVSLRSDTAGYQEELLLYCGEGKDAPDLSGPTGNSKKLAAEFRTQASAGALTTRIACI
jgi:hypothetical protein